MSTATHLVKAKGFLTSKTVWLGALALAIALLEYATTVPMLQQYWEAILGVVGALVIVLRFVTSAPIAPTPVASKTVEVSTETGKKV